MSSETINILKDMFQYDEEILIEIYFRTTFEQFDLLGSSFGYRENVRNDSTAFI